MNADAATQERKYFSELKFQLELKSNEKKNKFHLNLLIGFRLIWINADKPR